MPDATPHPPHGRTVAALYASANTADDLAQAWIVTTPDRRALFKAPDQYVIAAEARAGHDEIAAVLAGREGVMMP